MAGVDAARSSESAPEPGPAVRGRPAKDQGADRSGLKRRPLACAASLMKSEVEPIEKIKQRCTQSAGDTVAFTERIKSMHMPTGDTIRWIDQYWQGENEIIAKFRAPLLQERAQKFCLKLHPGIIDGSIQPLFLLIDEANKCPYITSKIGAMTYFEPNEGSLYLWAKLNSNQQTARQISGDWFLLTEEGRLVAACTDINLIMLGENILFENNENRSIMNSSVKKLNLSNYPKSEHYQRLLDFLCQQVAVIFKMSIDEIAVHQPLQDMGMDSLMAIGLNQCIEKGLDMNYSLQKLMQPISLCQIAHELLGKDFEPIAIESNINISSKFVDINPWIAYRQRNSETKLKLICFPYGGGGASIYRNWGQYLPAGIEVCPVQLPGRESRIQEKPITHLQTLIHDLYLALKDEIILPYAFFGHSFGSLIAFELTRYIQQQSQLLPQHLFVSGFPAPHLQIKKFQDLLQNFSDLSFSTGEYTMSDLTDIQLQQIMNICQRHHLIENNDEFSTFDLLRTILPILFADSQLVSGYQYIELTPLTIPITAFYGTEDKFIHPKTIKNWEKHTTHHFKKYPFAGGHMFIKHEPQLRQILSILASLLIN